MESTECIAAHSTARTILLHSATITAATSSRTADSTPVGVSRSSAVVVMGLLNQPPPTVLGLQIALPTGTFVLSEVFGEVSICSLALATGPPRPAPYLTTGYGVVLNNQPDIRWSSREGRPGA